MRRLVWFSVGLVALAPALSCVAASAPARAHLSQSFPAPAGKLVRLELRSLDAEVSVVPGDVIKVDVDLEARSSSPAAARRWVERRTPTFEDTPTRLDVRVPSSRGGLFLVGFFESHGKVRVVLPPTCKLEVESSSGDVQLSGDAPLDGAVHIDTSSGDVEVRGGVSQLVVETSSGDVRVDGPRLELLQAQTSSGDVRLRGGARRAIIDTSSGDVILRSLSGELSAHTSSGDVRADWQGIASQTRVSAEATSGDVTLSLPSSAEPHGTLETRSGRIDSEFKGQSDRRDHTLTLDGGGIDLTVHTSSGDITLRSHADAEKR